MTDLSRVSFQVRHYRELARIARDCAHNSAGHRAAYLELANQWTVLADQLETAPGEPATPARKETVG